MQTWAILLAAGRSSRLASGGVTTPKQFLTLEGEPVFWRSARTFARLAPLRGIIFAMPPAKGCALAAPTDAAEDGQALCAGYSAMIRGLEAALPGGSLGLPWHVTLGGALRQDSVFNSLALLPPDCEAVLIHDSARPFASAGLMTRVLDGLLRGESAVIPGIPVVDTIKAVRSGGAEPGVHVETTFERERLRAVQTPQGFRLDALRAAHARARAEGWKVTDDASLLERCGVPVAVVDGEETNRKLTTFADLFLLEAAKEERVPDDLICTGFGYDVHRFGGNRPFILGGVPIACDVTLEAHSDGDVLLHALADALLGCVGGGDIGCLFPDTDPTYEGISSGVLLAETLERCRALGFTPLHADLTVVAQTPRIAPHRQAIAVNVAKLLGLPAERVNVKATTEELLGFTGEKKGIKAMALVTGRRSFSGPK